MNEKITARNLKHEAKLSCLYREHKMTRYIKTGPGRYYAECKTCGNWVQVCVHPLPNEIDIGGPAVALNCEGK